MSALPSFHTKAVAEKKADQQAAKGECQKADEFLSLLDELLAEGPVPASLQQS